MADYMAIAALGTEGSFRAYCARPDGVTRKAVVVIQEIFGVNAGIRAKVDHWAEQGYLALAPDMFWRFRPGYDVDPDIPEQAKEAFEIRAAFDPDAGARDVEAAVRAARDLVGGGKVGVVGFCMGGRMAYLAATRTDADASVGYYGAGIDKLLGEAHAIAKPLMLHFGDQDHFIPAEVRAEVHAALGPNRHVTLHNYPGVDHGFAATSGRRRNDGAAEQADARTRAFLAEHLA